VGVNVLYLLDSIRSQQLMVLKLRWREATELVHVCVFPLTGQGGNKSKIVVDILRSIYLSSI
jgi:hypothetical protein